MEMPHDMRVTRKIKKQQFAYDTRSLTGHAAAASTMVTVSAGAYVAADGQEARAEPEFSSGDPTNASYFAMSSARGMRAVSLSEGSSPATGTSPRRIDDSISRSTLGE